MKPPNNHILDGASLIQMPDGSTRPRIGDLAKLSSGGLGGRSLGAAKAEAAYVSFATTFNDRLKPAQGIGRSIATVIEDPNLLHTEMWTTAAPLLRDWVGPKLLHKLRAESFSITTSPKEASIEIPKNDILTDRYGLWMPKIAGLADAFEWGINDFVIGMLVGGLQGTVLGSTYDGQNLFDFDHTALSIGGTSQSNIVTGALSVNVYDSAWIKYLSMLNENGQPVNNPGKKVRLIYGPANRQIVKTILIQQHQAGGADNVDAGTAEPVETGYITAGRTITIGGNTITLTGLEWFLVPENSSSIIVQIKRPPELLSVEDGAYVFLNAKHLYGVEAEFGGAYGLWQEIVGGPGA